MDEPFAPDEAKLDQAPLPPFELDFDWDWDMQSYFKSPKPTDNVESPLKRCIGKTVVAMKEDEYYGCEIFFSDGSSVECTAALEMFGGGCVVSYKEPYAA